ncbi:hypothetical protein C8F04DRAFT_948236 [Mycena alexandri]|uniref:F-box domain-containing protein n=1 Tax=Mycena alexandri TaxID=1745969 RepID=A0AAD6T891_9AGAR|nr:hypothetical protein C8F04DRAFT_948236 [Mycena alexandri]
MQPFSQIPTPQCHYTRRNGLWRKKKKAACRFLHNQKAACLDTTSLIIINQVQAKIRRSLETLSCGCVTGSFIVSTIHSQFPQELVDEVIECLYDDPQSLRACSLVSRAWVPRSRSYLFKTCNLVPKGIRVFSDFVLSRNCAFLRHIRTITASGMPTITTSTHLHPSRLAGVHTCVRDEVQRRHHRGHLFIHLIRCGIHPRHAAGPRLQLRVWVEASTTP